MSRTITEISVGHILVSVKDAARSAEFYRRLELDVVGEFNGLVIIELRGGTHILLSESDPKQDVTPQRGIDLMIDGNTRTELETYRTSLIKNGIQAAPINIQPRFGHYFFSINDPDGNHILFNTSHEVKFRE